MLSQNVYQEMVETDGFTDQLSGDIRMKSKLGGLHLSNQHSFHKDKEGVLGPSHGSQLEEEL